MTDDRRPSLIELREETREGRLGMAAARGTVGAVALLNRAFAASGINQHELAERACVTDGRVSQVLNGDGNVRVSTLARFLRALGYHLRLSAVRAEPDVELLPVPRRRRRERVREQFRFVSVAACDYIGWDGVGSEMVVQVTRSHPSALGLKAETVLDLETGEVERPEPTAIASRWTLVSPSERVHVRR